MHTSLLTRLLSAVVALGSLMFSFDSYTQDYSQDRWQVGDPWDQRFPTGIAQDQRDTALEDHVNADYVQHDFTAVINQLGNVPTTVIHAKFTRGAKVEVEMALKATAAGGGASQILVLPTGLPPGKTYTSLVGNTTPYLGSYVYYQIGVAIHAGITTWDNTTLVLYDGGSHTQGVGGDPAFVVANGDTVIINFSYTPAP